MDGKQPQLNLFETRLKVSQFRELVAVLYKGMTDAPALRKVWRDVAGDLVAGQFLEECVNWDERMHDKRDGWWYKDTRSWEDQAGIGEMQMKRCRKILETAGLICTMKRPKSSAASTRTWHFRVNWEALWRRLAAVLQRPLEELAALVVRMTQGMDSMKQPAPIDELSNGTPQNIGSQSMKQPAPIDETPGDSTLYSSSSSTPESTSSPLPAAPDARFIAIWESALGQLEALLDRQSYQFWLKKAELAGVEDQTLLVQVRSPEVADYCQGRLGRVVTRVVNDAAEIHGMDSGDWQVRFECNPTRCTPPPAPPQRIGRGETPPAITPVAVTTPLPKVWKVPSRAMAMAGGVG